MDRGQPSKKLVAAEATLRLSAMLRAKRPVMECVWPDPSVEIPFRLRLLTLDEVQVARAAAFKRCASPPEEGGMGIDPTLSVHLEVLRDETFLQVLHLAMLDPAKDDTLAASADDLRKAITHDQRVALLDMYRDFEARHDRSDGHDSPEVRAAVEDLLKKKDLEALVACGSRTLATYMLTSAAQPAISTTERSEHGS